MSLGSGTACELYSDCSVPFVASQTRCFHFRPTPNLRHYQLWSVRPVIQYTGMVFPQDMATFFRCPGAEQIQSSSWISSPCVDARRRIWVVLTKVAINLVHQTCNFFFLSVLRTALSTSILLSAGEPQACRVNKTSTGPKFKLPPLFQLDKMR
ncbi:hypothetical protein PILCRDRAFT_203057 [Piloderma croceum F 1598]|uniref:Uncharacterized protein n=1 Tax=Piloderma croceum (strain F 1598) TaxID=765440 RepID=A0A0C3CJP8_PILCF|nr:hypothetical protein PILCRDRAFT_203057 [Piloderma croceum F 1598]